MKIKKIMFPPELLFLSFKEDLVPLCDVDYNGPKLIELNVVYMGHNFWSDTTPKNEVVRSGLKFGWLESYLMLIFYIT